MGLPYPTRRGNSSLTLVVTFGLGLLIGAALFYAVADAMGWDFSARSANRIAQTAPAPEDPAPQDPVPAPAAPADVTPAPAPETPAPPATPAPEPPKPIEVNATDEDIAKHLMVDLQGTTLDDATKALLASTKPGLVFLRAQNLQDKAQGIQLAKDIKAACGGEGLDAWPLLAASQEGGADNPLFVAEAPSAQDLASGNDFDKNVRRVRDVAIAYGVAAREMQVAILLAPRLDVFIPLVSDPSLEARSFGEVPQDASDLGNAFQLGLREAGALAVAKHFPGLGMVTKDEDGSPTIAQREVRLLVELMLPFGDAAANGVAGMLVAHVSVPGLLNETPKLSAAHSSTLLQRILRDQMGFSGVVLADDISSSPLTSGQPVGEAVAKAIAAGCDIVYLGALEAPRIAEAIAGVRAALQRGEITQEAWDASTARLDKWREFLRQEPLAKAAKPKAEPTAQPKDTKKEVHRVERGETLEGIAKEYNVSVDDLVAWNALEEKKVRYAQRLNVYVPLKPAEEENADTTDAAPIDEAKPAEAKPEEAPPADAPKTDEPKAEAPKPDNMKPDEKQAEEKKPEEKAAGEDKGENKPEEKTTEEKPSEGDAPKPADATATPSASDTPKAEEKPFQTHLIVKGDTLRRLAERYKTTEKELLQMNNLSSPDKILLGTKLKVPKQ